MPSGKSTGTASREMAAESTRESYPSRTAWLKARGIGASDAPIILGLAPWPGRTALRLYAEKLGLIDPPEQTEAQELGLALEPIVAARWERATGRQLCPIPARPEMHRSRRYPWLTATLD